MYMRMYLSICRHVFSRTVAVADAKRGYVGRYNAGYNGRSAHAAKVWSGVVKEHVTRGWGPP